MQEPIIFHDKTVEEIFSLTNSSSEGLKEEEITQRRQKFGFNEIITQQQRSRLKMLGNQFNNSLVYVLIAAGVISLIVGKIANLIVIAVIIIANGIIGFVQEVKAEKALNSLKMMAAPEATVLRECEDLNYCIQIRIKSREIVPGDIILLESGDKVPADARLFEAVNLQIDESMLTGESIPVQKIIEPTPVDASLADRKNLIYSGTIVKSGRGKAIVYAIGMQTEMGKIAQLINQTEKMKSPLEKRVGKLSKRLGILAIIASLTTFLIGILRGFDIVEMFIFAIASLVSSIPAGLPAIITITLAIGVSRMAKRNAIIRKLDAIDSLGAVTSIVSDKTGTLTQNQMTAQKLFVDNKEIDVTGIGYTPIGEFIIEGNPISLPKIPTLEKLLESAILCNDSNLREYEISENEYRWEIIGDPTEGALVVLAHKSQLNKRDFYIQYPRKDEIPFDSKNKYMLTIHDKGMDTALHMKGAPEVVLSLCNKVILNDKIVVLDTNELKQLKEQANKLAARGYRVLGVASGVSSSKNYEQLKLDFQKGDIKLNFLGFVGIIDPPREEVKEAIQRAQQAGIKIFMATGDHKLTATSIGQEIGILDHSFMSLSGNELDHIDDQALYETIKNTRVFARVTPEHKFRIVNALKRTGEIVAMTGDGANDAPALKNAEVGVAMGITGTDVTKDAASMILMDDNFASIVNAVEEGRVVYENIKKGIKFLLTTNMGEIFTILLSMILVSSQALIFTPIMILWVNLVTDGSLTVTLASEPKESDVMNRPPKDPKEPLIDKSILINIFITAGIMAAGVLFVFEIYGRYAPTIKRETLSFAALAILQIFNAISSRSRRESIIMIGFRKNIAFLYGLLISFSLQIIAVQVGFFNVILETTPLSFIDWLVIIGIGSIILIVDEIRKFILRRKPI